MGLLLGFKSAFIPALVAGIQLSVNAGAIWEMGPGDKPRYDKY